MECIGLWRVRKRCDKEEERCGGRWKVWVNKDVRNGGRRVECISMWRVRKRCDEEEEGCGGR